MIELNPITPAEAIKRYKQERKHEVSRATFLTIESGLRAFEEWSDEADLENLNDLTGRKITAFRDWKRETSDINNISLNGTLAVLRRFLKYGVRNEMVDDSVPGKVPLSDVDKEDEVRAAAPSNEHVAAVREYLAEYDYASRRHVEHKAMEEIGLRMGALRGIDEDQDYLPDDCTIRLRHRPEDTGVRGTPLKNGSDGERNINISTELRDLINDYLNNPARPEVTDKFGRNPLFTTDNGRVSLSQIRDDLYVVTRPCEHGHGCPIGRDISECDASSNRYAYRCPETYSPHPLRTWSIMRQLDEDVTRYLLSDRVDTSVPVLKKHYDQRAKERKRKQRKRDLAANLPEYEDDESSASSDPGKQPAVANPLAGLLLGGVQAGSWFIGRLTREVRWLQQSDDRVLVPGKRKAATGLAVYALFVMFLAVDLSLLGVVNYVPV